MVALPGYGYPLPPTRLAGWSGRGGGEGVSRSLPGRGSAGVWLCRPAAGKRKTFPPTGGVRGKAQSGPGLQELSAGGGASSP
ncbi:hypothetical protein FKM82_017767 [Ascaphus truei]